MKLYKKHISDLGKVITGKTPRTSILENYGGKIPFLTPSDNLSEKFSPTTSKTLTKIGLNEVKNCLLPSKSICVSCIGSDLGKVVLTKKPTVTNQQFNSIVPNEENDADFIYYLMTVVGKYLNYLSKTSTAVPIINKSTFANYEIEIPNIKEQKRIGKILSSLDDKIELNRRINDNLEQQAQALFKSWFVDNPNSNWKKISLSEVASFVGGYSYTGKELTDFSNVAMATIKNFVRNGGFKAGGFKGINPSAKLKECHYANLFDILVAHTDLTQNADVIGNTELLLTCGKYNSIIFSMDLVKVLPKEIFPYRFLLATMLKNKMFKGHCLGYINGTTVLHLNKKALPEFEIRKPSDSEAKIMNEILAPYYKRMAKLLQETDKLISLRDTLLPKLMSGELKINDINN
ncbi:restriction endonuclease subunit S [Prevotella pallens]|uniref:EcoKI restriction-modification system protein HsdS n=1 Tax=Prevotella pallens TaxID=60133 RepID=A0A379GC92_9BACT|nr:restriction endonuclease subunit S [Prevotella pallens]SUC38143.1 EcoKI restriction-modification system protein HsdS [Prevotella pallens]